MVHRGMGIRILINCGSSRCQLGSVFGLLGGSRCLHRVPRALLFARHNGLVNCQKQAFGPISDRFWTKVCDLYVMFVLPLCYLLFGFRPRKAVHGYLFMKSGLLWLSASYFPDRSGTSG